MQLDLTGNQLRGKSAALLGDALGSCQLRSITLENVELDEKGVAAVGIKHSSTIKRIRLTPSSKGLKVK